MARWGRFFFCCYGLLGLVSSLQCANQITLNENYLVRAAPTPNRKTFCEENEKKYVDSHPDLTSQPFTSLATSPAVSDTCKKELLKDLLDNIRAQFDQKPCPPHRCENFRAAVDTLEVVLRKVKEPFCFSKQKRSCVLNPEYALALHEAEELIAQTMNQELVVIEEKIRKGRIPLCLLPRECLAASPACRQELLRRWWQDNRRQYDSHEYWIEEGSFFHFLVGRAFSCGAGKQEGDTCAVYSGVSLMSHYCATPAENPNARYACMPQGAGFRCVSSEEFLMTAYRLGSWTATECFEDNLRSQSVCQVALSAAVESQEMTRFFGETGISLENLKDTYRYFGFDIKMFMSTEPEWNRILETLNEGHPVQVTLDPSQWFDYRQQKKESIRKHAVILEGRFKDDRGVVYVLFRDSNNPQHIRMVENPVILKDYLAGSGGGLRLCTRQDPLPCLSP